MEKKNLLINNSLPGTLHMVKKKDVVPKIIELKSDDVVSFSEYNEIYKVVASVKLHDFKDYYFDHMIWRNDGVVDFNGYIWTVFNRDYDSKILELVRDIDIPLMSAEMI